jgi:thiol-disulfide isomerase/thioredoxin
MPKDKKPDSRMVKNFSFLDMEGQKHAFNDYHGKWIIVNYWASYCPPCRVEVTDIDIFARENKNKAVVLGMDAGGDTVDELLKFQKEFKLSYPLIPAQESTLLAFGAVEALPTTFIISPQGKLIEKHVGMITYDDLHFYTQPPKTQLSRK